MDLFTCFSMSCSTFVADSTVTLEVTRVLDSLLEARINNKIDCCLAISTSKVVQVGVALAATHLPILAGRSAGKLEWDSGISLF